MHIGNSKVKRIKEKQESEQDDKENEENKSATYHVGLEVAFHRDMLPVLSKQNSNQAPAAAILARFYGMSNNATGCDSNHCGNNGGAMKRGCDDVEAETEDDLLTVSSASTECERRSPPKKPKFFVTPDEIDKFFDLLDGNSINEFLRRDSCHLISDKVSRFLNQ
jgi:hypothetical protein